MRNLFNITFTSSCSQSRSLTLHAWQITTLTSRCHPPASTFNSNMKLNMWLEILSTEWASFWLDGSSFSTPSTYDRNFLICIEKNRKRLKLKSRTPVLSSRSKRLWTSSPFRFWRSVVSKSSGSTTRLGHSNAGRQSTSSSTTFFFDSQQFSCVSDWWRKLHSYSWISFPNWNI